MADITMCGNKECTKKETCYRFIAPPTPEWQSMFGGNPTNEDGACDKYWKAAEYEIEQYEERQNGR